MLGERLDNLHTFARFIHESVAAATVLAVAYLFLLDWRRGATIPYPAAGLTVALVLAIGCTLARSSLRLMNRVAADDDVSELLLSKQYQSAGDDEDRPRGPWRLLSMVMPVQIMATAVIGLGLVTMIQLWPPPSASQPNSSSPAATSQPTSSPATTTLRAAASPVTDWDTLPAIAAIALSELMYLAWVFEGEAASHELIAISRRWNRRRRVDAQAQADAGPAVAIVRPAVPEPRPPVQRARQICELLARYGVDLTPPPDAIRSG